MVTYRATSAPFTLSICKKGQKMCECMSQFGFGDSVRCDLTTRVKLSEMMSGAKSCEHFKSLMF